MTHNLANATVPPLRGDYRGVDAIDTQRTRRGSANNPRLQVRIAQRTDEAPLQFFFDTALRNDYFLRRGQLRDMLASPYHCVYVAEIDQVLVGVAITTRGTRLVNALVHPAYRGLGIGRALVERTGCVEVRAKLDMSTGDPRGFYRSLGFQPVGRANAKGNIELMRKPAAATSRNSRTPKRK